jgi:hypothetical protein
MTRFWWRFKTEADRFSISIVLSGHVVLMLSTRHWRVWLISKVASRRARNGAVDYEDEDEKENEDDAGRLGKDARATGRLTLANHWVCRNIHPA